MLGFFYFILNSPPPTRDVTCFGLYFDYKNMRRQCQINTLVYLTFGLLGPRSHLNILRSWVPGSTLGVPSPGSHLDILGSQVSVTGSHLWMSWVLGPTFPLCHCCLLMLLVYRNFDALLPWRVFIWYCLLRYFLPK